MDGIPSQITGEDTWEVAGRRFRSRLIVGTGRYKDLEETGRAIAASGAEIVTVAVRRVNLADPNAPMLQAHVDPRRYTYLPNTAGCFTAQDAVRTLRLAREGVVRDEHRDRDAVPVPVPERRQARRPPSAQRPSSRLYRRKHAAPHSRPTQSTTHRSSVTATSRTPSPPGPWTTPRPCAR